MPRGGDKSMGGEPRTHTLLVARVDKEHYTLMVVQRERETHTHQKTLCSFWIAAKHVA